MEKDSKPELVLSKEDAPTLEKESKPELELSKESKLAGDVGEVGLSAATPDDQNQQSADKKPQLVEADSSQTLLSDKQLNVEHTTKQSTAESLEKQDQEPVSSSSSSLTPSDEKSTDTQCSSRYKLTNTDSPDRTG